MEYKQLIQESLDINKNIVSYIEEMRLPAIKYEELFNFKRQLGITGEFGKIYVCYYLNLRLMIKPTTAGFNAIDKSGNKVQIKTVRKNPTKDYLTDENSGKLTRFSEHKFDYCILLILDKYYKPCEMWKATGEDLKELIINEKSKKVLVKDFKKVGLQLEIPNPHFKA